MITRLLDRVPTGALAMRRAFGWLTVASLVLWAVAVPTGWINSVAFISHISMAALVLALLLAWLNCRVEVKQDESGNGGSDVA